MKKLGEFLKGLVIKAGQNPEAEGLKAFLEAPDLMTLDTPDELVTALDHNLLSVKDATNNHPDIKKFYDAQTLDRIDKDILQIIGDDEELKNALAPERSTYKKIPLLISKIKELEKLKATASSKPDKDAIQQQKEAYQKQLDDLTFKLRSLEGEKDKLKKEYDDQVVNIKKESKLNHMVSGYKTIYDDLEPEIKWDTLNAILSRELQKNNAEFYFDETGNFALRKKDGTNFIGDNHQEVLPQPFIEQILSRNKLLKVTSPNDQQQNADGNNSTQANGFNAPGNGQGNGKPVKDYTLIELTKTALADYQRDAAFNQ